MHSRPCLSPLATQRVALAASQSADGAVAADMPVRIRLLAVDNLSTRISFQGDPLSRPRRVGMEGGRGCCCMLCGSTHFASHIAEGVVSMVQAASPSAARPASRVQGPGERAAVQRDRPG